jgi:Alpha/beta hydrolase family
MPPLPEYTSPPLLEALEATPIEWRSDQAIQAKRDAAAHRACGNDDAIDGTQEFCQLGFPGHTTTGVILYGGAMMDPRSYSPLARMLQTWYGFTVVVPVFERDLAWDYQSCTTGRVNLARAEFPQVDRWILAGHSFGAIAASLDLWSLYSNNEGSNLTDTGVQGMVFMAADARDDLGCGSLDFSESGFPFASLTASLDEVLNLTRYRANRRNLPADAVFVEVVGGNHGNFGSSNFTMRSSILKIQDGHATISQEAQQETAAKAIANVASRAGWKPVGVVSSIHVDAIVLLLLIVQAKSMLGFI